MESGVTAASVFGVLAISGVVISTYFEKRKQKRRAAEGLYPSSFAYRHQKMLDEIQAKKTAEQLYHERIEAAFNEARECGALLVSEVDYADIECDMFRNRGRHPGDLPKPLLTRITPVITQEFAERVRAYEILAEDDLFEADEERAQICLSARTIKWRVEEVPVRHEPPKLRDNDRIRYPDLSFCFGIPKEISEAARKMLGYDYEYIKEQALLLDNKDDSFEVTEE